MGLQNSTWSTVEITRRLPRFCSPQLPVRCLHSANPCNTRNSQVNSLHSTGDPHLSGSQGLFQGAFFRRHDHLADAFRGRLRLQLANETFPLQFPYFLTARVLPPGNSAYGAHVSTQQRTVFTTRAKPQPHNFLLSAALRTRSGKVTSWIGGENADPFTVTKTSSRGKRTADVIQLLSSDWRLICERKSIIVPRTWLVNGLSFPLSRGAEGGEHALLPANVVSTRALLSCGVDTRGGSCLSARNGSGSHKLLTVDIGLHLPLVAGPYGGFGKQIQARSCSMTEDTSVAQDRVIASPVGVSVCGSKVEEFPRLFKPVTSQCRLFGGRAGGLKRRKPKKDPGVVIQTGLGRRQEFFWPVEARRTRVPFYQNSRPNLIFDQRFKRFMCMWYSNGIQVFRPFSCRGRRGGRGKHGAPDGLGIGRGSGTWERARAKAVALLKQLQEQGKLKNLPKPDICRSGVRGVYFDSEEKLWVATWNEHGLRRFKAFPTMEMGFDAAYQAAVAVRRQKLLENYMFCMQRNRKKSGRLPLK